MAEKLNIFWFRRDLRLNDNAALSAALQSGNKVLPIFIFDENILSELPEDDARVSFIYKTLNILNEQLGEFGAGIAIYHGKPETVFSTVLQNYNIQEVFTNRDYEPYALQRDLEIQDFLATRKIPLHTYKDQVIFEKDEIVKKDGTPYLVYTPYMKAWRSTFSEKMIYEHEVSSFSNQFFKNGKLPFPSLSKIGFVSSKIIIPEADLSPETIQNYENHRNFPAKDATSRLGVHLRFGTISIRKVIKTALQDSNDTFLKELVWREFFMQILYHFPNTVHEAFHKKYDKIKWRNNEADFLKWKNGNTGFPLVDAGMRQLNATGFMHNRVRMLVASFLCKHLLIDWRWGEAYFAEKLLDYELASNVGNWQWAAGTGVDAAPYFRIFNPTTQIEKFDKNNEYIKKWVPDFGAESYPDPMVDHKEARERCLAAYKAVV